MSSASTSDHRSTILLGFPFGVQGTAATLDLVEEMIANRSRNTIATANLDTLVQAMDNPIFKRSVYTASLVTPDGTPLVWAGKNMTPQMQERVAGSDFIPMLLERAAEAGHSVFILGGKSGVAELAAEQSKARWPGLKIAGTYSPPFSSIWEMDVEGIVKRINATAPDILLVGFGNPKQEYWMSINYFALDVPVSFGVGATIDFLSGRIPRAPEWMRSIGAEWIFRLSLEPNRLASRYYRDLKYGLTALLYQTISEMGSKLSARVSHRPTELEMQISKTSIQSPSAVVNSLFVQVGTRGHFIELLEKIDAIIEEENHALVIDIRSVGAITSENISMIVEIDRQMRRTARHCVLIVESQQDRPFRADRIDDMLTIVRNRREAENHLRTMGVHPLAVSMHTTESQVSVLKLSGDLSLFTAPLLESMAKEQLHSENLVADISDVKFIDAAGIWYMWKLCKSTSTSAEGIPCFVGSAPWRPHLATNGFEKKLNLFSSIDEAIESITSQRISEPDTHSGLRMVSS